MRRVLRKHLNEQTEFLRQQQKLLNETRPRRDAVLFLPMRRWIETDHCRASELAAELTRANVQFAVICEDDLVQSAKSQSGALRTAKRMSETPTASEEAPATSTGSASEARDSIIRVATRKNATAPSGMLIEKMDLQPKCTVRNAPSSGVPGVMIMR